MERLEMGVNTDRKGKRKATAFKMSSNYCTESQIRKEIPGVILDFQGCNSIHLIFFS